MTQIKQRETTGAGGVNRRRFLTVSSAASAALAAAACAPQAAPAPAAAPAQPAAPAPQQPAAWQQEWDKLVAAAKQEGKLVILTRPGSGYRKALDEFEKTFPGITVDHTSMVAVQYVPRLTQERQAGVYSLDAMVSTFGATGMGLRDAGGLEPLTPILFRPDIADDKAWADGFSGGWLDRQKQFAYGTSRVRTRWLWVNTDLVQDGEIKSVQDLLNPKWKGKIISADPRAAGWGYAPGALMWKANGDDIVKKFWKDQEAVLSRDYRQMMEGLIKGRFAIGLAAVNDTILPDFLKDGIGKNIKPLDIDNIDYVGIGLETAMLVNKAPHPNTAKLFLNWLLSKDGQTVWSKFAETNSRRLDVPPTRPDLVPPPERKLPLGDLEELEADRRKVIELATAVLA